MGFMAFKTGLAPRAGRGDSLHRRSGRPFTTWGPTPSEKGHRVSGRAGQGAVVALVGGEERLGHPGGQPRRAGAPAGAPARYRAPTNCSSGGYGAGAAGSATRVRVTSWPLGPPR